MARAMAETMVSYVWRVAREVFEKLMVRPVACTKLFRVTPRDAAATREVEAMMSVSSAYWRIMGRRWEKMGWWRAGSEFWKISCWSRSATTRKR